MIESSYGILTGSWKSCMHLVKMGEHLSGHQNEQKHFCNLGIPTPPLLSWFSSASKLLILHPDAITYGLWAALWHENKKKTLREWWTGTTTPRAPHLNNDATHERRLCVHCYWNSLLGAVWYSGQSLLPSEGAQSSGVKRDNLQPAQKAEALWF